MAENDHSIEEAIGDLEHAVQCLDRVLEVRHQNGHIRFLQNIRHGIANHLAALKSLTPQK